MAKRSRNTVKRKRRRLIFGIELVVLLVLVGVLFVYANITNKLGKIDISDSADSADVKVNEQVVGSKVMKGYTNIALFGVDSRDENLDSSNSDTTIVASINNDTKEVKLVSIYRDTYLNIGQDKDKYDKANAAYAIGGPVQAMSMLNTNMDLNIKNYVAVDFNALVKVIDLLGGLDVDLSYEEIEHMNNYCVETSKVTGKSYEKIEPEVEGTYHLNGVQAVSYSRIRYTAGGDFKRAERQRLVLEKIADKVQNMSVGTVNKIIDSVFPQISTNFTLAEMIGYAKNLTKYKLGDSIGFPADNTTDMLNEVGSVVIPDTLSSNVMEVHKFLFGNDGYTVSSTITSVENGIAEKSSDKAKSDSTVDDDEVPGSAGYKSTYSNSASGTTGNTSGTTGRGYGTTTGTTGGYSSGSATGSGTTTGTTGSSYGTTGGNYGTTTGGTTAGTTSGTTTETTDGTE